MPSLRSTIQMQFYPGARLANCESRFSPERSGPMFNLPSRAFRPTVVLIVVVLASPAQSSFAANAPAESLIAIGDVHGDFDDFIVILQHAGLIDKQNHWAGGRSTFVQTGDLIDRG